VLDAIFQYLTTSDYQYEPKLLEAAENWDNGRDVVNEEMFFHAEVYATAGRINLYPRSFLLLTASRLL
jgi:hypothetical protein